MINVLPDSANLRDTYDGRLEGEDASDENDAFDAFGDDENIPPFGKGTLNRRWQGDCLLVPGKGEDLVGSRMFGEGRRAPLLEGDVFLGVLHFRAGDDGDCVSDGLRIGSKAVTNASLVPWPTSITWWNWETLFNV